MLLIAAQTFAQDVGTFLKPPSNVTVDGIPPIPADLTAKVAAYTEFKPSAMVAWHPLTPGMMVRSRLSDTDQLLWIAAPGAKPVPISDFSDEVGTASYQPKRADYIVFARAVGGDEVFRLYRMDLPGRQVTAISPEQERASAHSWNRNGDKIVYTAANKLLIVDPLKPDAARVVTTLKGGHWSGFCFSPDEKSLLMIESVSAAESHLWQMDIATGNKRRVTPPPKTAPVAYAHARWARDGRTVFATSDRGAEFRRLVSINVASGDETALTGHIDHDVDAFALSSAANRIAFTTNEGGASVLRFLDLKTLKELPRPALLPGEISGLRWRGEQDGEGDPSGAEIAFNLASARAPSEVYSYNVTTTKLTRWTNGASSGLNPLDFASPTRVMWKSLDGLMISGFLYQPNAGKFPGKRPVQIVIHGGPQGQARLGFIAHHNYAINELGIALIFPNVRGSSGFGKTFQAADNGVKREDSVADLGALLDWIKTQPDLDAARVLVSGEGDGGYLAQAVASRYPKRIVGVISFATTVDFVAPPSGTERDPTTRELLKKNSPLNNTGTKPMLIAHGKNDPRVPFDEAMQIVDRLKRQRVPVWFLLANDEGHGFARKSNRDFLLCVQVMFFREVLLR